MLNESNILTATAQLGNLELIAQQVVEGFIIGMHKSPFHGFSAEFAEHRLYNTGETTRHIDWKVLARTDKTFVKRYEEETNLRAHILIDTSSSMYYPELNGKDNQKLNKISFSVLSAAVLMNVLKRQRDAFGLTLFDDEIKFQSEARSTTVHQKFLIHQLQQLSVYNGQSHGSQVAQSIHALAEKIHRRSLVIIFSDMLDKVIGDENEMEKIWSSLQHLKHNKHEVILFHVQDKKTEINFEFENRPYRFIDLETHEEIKLKPAEIKEKYIDQMQKISAVLKTKCHQLRVDLVEADIQNGFDQILIPYFVKRTKLH